MRIGLVEVFLTQNAKDGLRDIFNYHCEYSEAYAEQFYLDITQFIIDSLSDFPEMGRAYNKKRKLFRVIYKQYNVYYAIRKDGVYVLFIVDGKLSFNSELEI